MQRRGQRLATLTTTLLAALTLRADWPQFMGPKGDGNSPEKGLRRSWPEGGPKVLWQMPLGKGYGGAAVRDGQVYLLDREGQQKDILRCLDLATGREQWTFAYEAPGRISHDGSRSTPAVSEKLVFTVGPFGHLHGLDRKTHQVVWKKNLLADYAGKLPNWAVAQSPVLYRDVVLAAPLGASVGVVAFDQATGREKWKSPALGSMAYVSPKVIAVAGMDQVVIINKEGVKAVSAEDGKLLWDFPHPCKIPIPNVSVLSDGKLFVTGGYNAGSAIIQVSRESGQWKAKELRRIEGTGGHCHPGLVYRDHLFVLCNTNERADGLVCFDFDGQLVWQTKRDPYLCKGGSVLTADGLMYLMDGRAGELHIIEPSSSGFKSLAKGKVLEGAEIWGPLALSDGKLIARDQSQVKCIDLRAN